MALLLTCPWPGPTRSLLLKDMFKLLHLHLTIQGPHHRGISNGPVTNGWLDFDWMAFLFALVNTFCAQPDLNFKNQNLKNTDLKFDSFQSTFHEFWLNTSHASHFVWVMTSYPMNQHKFRAVQSPSEFRTYRHRQTDTYRHESYVFIRVFHKLYEIGNNGIRIFTTWKPNNPMAKYYPKWE